MKRSNFFHEEKRGKKGMIHVYWRDPDGGQRSKAVSTDSDAVYEFKLQLADRLQRRKTGLNIRNYPLDHFINEYMLEKSFADKQPRTTKRDALTIKIFRRLLPHITDVDQYTASALNTYKALRRREGRQESTVNRELGTLKSMIKFAYAKRYRDVDDSGEVTFYDVSSCAREKVLTDRELKSLFKSAAEPYHCAYMLGFWAGLRAGEACHLEVSDVSFADNVIKIRKKPDWRPKNRTSVRDVPLHSVLKRYLMARVKTLKSSYLCSYDDGRRLSEGVLASMIYKTREDLGLGRDFCFHILRHTFVSRMAAGGADTYAISKIIGHSNTQITEDTYTHLKSKYFHANINKLK